MTPSELLKKTHRILKKNPEIWCAEPGFQDEKGRYVRSAEGHEDERVARRCIENSMRMLVDGYPLKEAIDCCDEAALVLYDRKTLLGSTWAVLEPSWHYVVECRYGYKAAMEMLELAIEIADNQ